MLPYFKRNASYTADDACLRGRDGPQTVSNIEWIHPICESFMQGARGLGMPRNPDYNGESQAGIGYFQRTNARATRIVFDRQRAVGVRYAKGTSLATERTVTARREVIVCTGALNTPKLLQLAGVGPAALLQSLGVPVVRDMPGVGANLNDHFSVRIVMGVKNTTPINELSRMPRLVGQVARWVPGKPSILALSPSLVHWFWNSKTERADLDEGIAARPAGAERRRDARFRAPLRRLVVPRQRHREDGAGERSRGGRRCLGDADASSGPTPAPRP